MGRKNCRMVNVNGLIKLKKILKGHLEIHLNDLLTNYFM